MTFDLALRTKTPLALSIRRATGNELETQSFIPGSAVRGALAFAWLDANGSEKAETPEFKSLFLSSSVRFGDLWPQKSCPAPLSARKCRGKGCTSGVVDYLLQSAAGSAIREGCPVCESKRERIAGFLRPGAGIEYILAKTETRRVAHTAIDPRLLRSANQQFHSAEVIAENQSFSGTIFAGPEMAPAVRALLTDNPELFLGRGRTRGQGRVRVDFDELEPGENAGADALTAFNRQAHARFPKLRTYLLFSCTFRSRCILLDDFLMSKAVPAAADLHQELGRYKLLASFHRMTEVVGWNSCAHLPKPESGAIDAGSAYLFGWETDQPEARFTELAALLRQLENSGIGERVEEGFGQAAFCDAIHFERAEAK